MSDKQAPFQVKKTNTKVRIFWEILFLQLIDYKYQAHCSTTRHTPKLKFIYYNDGQFLQCLFKDFTKNTQLTLYSYLLQHLLVLFFTFIWSAIMLILFLWNMTSSIMASNSSYDIYEAATKWFNLLNDLIHCQMGEEQFQFSFH